MVRMPTWWVRVALFFALLLAWTGLGIEEFAFAAVAGVIAATVSHRLAHRDGGRFRVGQFLRFVPFFIGVAIRGGVDVARRAFSPSMPLKPGFVDYRLRVDPGGRAVVFFGAVISLVPGTLFVELVEGQTLVVHVVDLDGEYRRELERLEMKIAALFGESLDA